MSYARHIRSLLVFLLCLASTSASAEIVGRIVAIVGDEVITQGDLDAAIALRKGGLSTLPQMGTNTGDPTTTLRTQVLDALIEQKLLNKKIENSTILVNDQELSTAIARIVSENNTSLEEIKRDLAKNGSSFEAYKANLRNELRQYKFIQKEIQPKVQVTDSDVADYYRTHASEFETFKQVRFSQILLVPTDTQSERDTFTLAAKLKQDIDAKKTGFREAAKTHSQGPFAENGGSSAWVEAKDINPDLLRILTSLKPGAVSEPLVTSAGILLVQLDERKETYIAPLQSVRKDIQNRVYQQKVNAALTQYLLSLRGQSYVQIMNPL